MTFNMLKAVLNETGLSPELLAPKLGVASMTLRRWQKKPGAGKLPKGYERTVLEGIYQLLAEGHLNSSSEAVKKVLAASSSLSFAAVLKSLEIGDAVSASGDSQQDKMTIALSQIGVNEKRRNEVDESKEKLQGFKKLGADWNLRVSALWNVVRSSRLTPIDKLVAYGALFYLIFPFDLIPDHIPVVGLIDDFGILGFAMAYYAKKFPELMKAVPPTA
jgi:uncharacterized membrane protein YkvA (DUF1232 family)